MGMSRKDYRAIADVLSVAQEVNGHVKGYDALAAVSLELGEYFAETNPNFDMVTFLRASGFETLAGIYESADKQAKEWENAGVL